MVRRSTEVAAMRAKLDGIVSDPRSKTTVIMAKSFGSWQSELLEDPNHPSIVAEVCHFGKRTLD